MHFILRPSDTVLLHNIINKILQLELTNKDQENVILIYIIICSRITFWQKRMV